MLSNHLILCHPLLLLPSIFPSIRVFSKESVLCIRWPKYWSFSFSISPSNEYSGLISFRMDWLDLLAVQRTLQSLLQHHSLPGLPSLPPLLPVFPLSICRPLSGRLHHFDPKGGGCVSVSLPFWLSLPLWHLVCPQLDGSLSLAPGPALRRSSFSLSISHLSPPSLTCSVPVPGGVCGGRVGRVLLPGVRGSWENEKDGEKRLREAEICTEQLLRPRVQGLLSRPSGSSPPGSTPPRPVHRRALGPCCSLRPVLGLSSSCFQSHCCCL